MARRTTRNRPGEIAHRYGPSIHVLSDVVLLTLLARLCTEGVVQPLFNTLVSMLYTSLVRRVVDHEFGHVIAHVPTRMTKLVGDKAIWHGPTVNPKISTVVVDIARGGTVPSEVCYSTLNWLLDPEFVRQDHLMMGRTVDAGEHVTGAAIGGSKIGGDVNGRFVLFPDCMGATGGSVARAIREYVARYGRPARIITLNLIITPEFVRTMLKLSRELGIEITVYALRLDRGMSSSQAVLDSVPGTFRTRSLKRQPKGEYESGLTPKGYIVPGGGGFGELMNNSWV